MKWMAVLLLVGQTRIASDFEIAQMQRQLATSHDFLSQLSGHLNLGDAYRTRNETATARTEYASALDIAGRESLAARKASDITRYATAVAYSSLANAKLGYDGAAFAAAEEALRYTSGSSKSWNLYSTAMTLLRKPAKAVSAARNAVEIATRDVARSPSIAGRIDLAVVQYSLATALLDNGNADEAAHLLRTVTASLRSDDFAPLRRDVARSESFEVYSSARGDQAAYLSLVNHAGLRLAGLLEKRGDVAGARIEYENVLANRSDDATALAALARLTTADEQERYFAAAFDANPFAIDLIRQYQKSITATTPVPADDTTGGRVRGALIHMRRGEMRAARETLEALLQQYPANDTLQLLRRETEPESAVPPFLSRSEASVAPTPIELRQLIALLRSDQLTPEQRAALDRITFTNTVTFDSATARDAQTIFESGAIGDVRFRFPEPTAFTGSFSTTARLTYRILGATEAGGADALLLEPVRLEQAP